MSLSQTYTNFTNTFSDLNALWNYSLKVFYCNCNIFFNTCIVTFLNCFTYVYSFITWTHIRVCNNCYGKIKPGDTCFLHKHKCTCNKSDFHPHCRPCATPKLRLQNHLIKEDVNNFFFLFFFLVSLDYLNLARIECIGCFYACPLSHTPLGYRCFSSPIDVGSLLSLGLYCCVKMGAWRC